MSSSVLSGDLSIAYGISIFSVISHRLSSVPSVSMLLG